MGTCISDNVAYQSTNSNKNICDTDTFLSQLLAGVSDQDLPHIGIYPNPSEGLIFFDGQTFDELTVYSEVGGIVFHSEVEQKGWDIRHLANATYVIKARKGAQLYTGVVIKSNP